MYESTQDATWVHGIDLAQEPGFDLGSLRVRPATCKIELNGVSQTLQRRVMQVLVALVQARGSVVSQNDLVIRCWRGLAVSDDAIYRCISKLRKLAADYPGPPYTIEAIPGVGYRLTSSGFAQHDSAPNIDASPSRRLSIRALVAAAALLVLLLAGAGFWMLPGRALVDEPLRVAVQPFETLTNSDDARALARRIPNEVVNQFGDSQIVTVLAAEQTVKVEEPAPGLILTGLVREDSPYVSVDVRVENGITRAALWSMEFKRDRREASNLPMEVAARVADVVNLAIFARSADPPLADDSALSALLQANDMIRDGNIGDWAQMIERAQNVVARHPEFAFGHDVLAIAYSNASEKIAVPERAQVMREAARREARLTLKLDPQDAGAYVVLSDLEASDDYRSQEAILLRGMKIAKHPKQPLGALYSKESALLSDVGRLREALSSQLVARAIDEWGAPKTAQLARLYANMGDLPSARSWIQKGVQIWPNHAGIRRSQRYVVGFYGQPSDALAIFDRVGPRSPADENEDSVWRTFIKAKTTRDARTTVLAIREIREAADQNKIPREIGIMMMAGLGQTTEAIETANFALAHDQQLRPWFLFAPVTRNIRQNPGFVSLAARFGLIRYWRETGRWPDICIDPAARSDCSPQLLAALQ